VGADGIKQPSVPVPLTDNRAVMMHDFAFTKNHAVFLDFPYVFDATQLLRGQPPLSFRPELKTRIGVLPRAATDTSGMRWFDINTGWAFHVANSWEVNNVITVLACRSPQFSLDQLGESGNERALAHAPRLYRYEIDLSKPDGAGGVSEKYLSERASEFPVCDERNRWGYATRYVWSAGTSPGKGRGFTSIIKHDLRDDGEIVFNLDDGCYADEFVFVNQNAPNVQYKGDYDASKDSIAPDDNGVLMGYVYNSKTNLSELLVLHADKMTLKARVKLNERVPHGFHGKFISQEQLDSERAAPSAPGNATATW